MKHAPDPVSMALANAAQACAYAVNAPTAIARALAYDAARQALDYAEQRAHAQGRIELELEIDLLRVQIP